MLACENVAAGCVSTVALYSEMKKSFSINKQRYIEKKQYKGIRFVKQQCPFSVLFKILKYLSQGITKLTEIDRYSEAIF